MTPRLEASEDRDWPWAGFETLDLVAYGLHFGLTASDRWSWAEVSARRDEQRPGQRPIPAGTGSRNFGKGMG